jgi:hypothetical protein
MGGGVCPARLAKGGSSAETAFIPIPPADPFPVGWR